MNTITPVFLIIGPPAVGKSTTSRALATHFAKSICIPVDDIRHMVVSGLELPSAFWSDELALQIRLARIAVSNMTLLYRNEVFTVVIDDFWDDRLLQDYQAVFVQHQVHKILLHPDQAEAHRRNLQRSGDSPARAYIDEGIRIVYKALEDTLPHLRNSGWHVLDTTHLSPEQTIQAILQFIKQ